MNALLLVSVLVLAVATPGHAQDLVVRRTDGSERRVSAAELATLPTVAVDATDHGVATRFEGVDLRAVLERAGVARTDSLRGVALQVVLVLVGADGYAATISLADLDPSLAGRQVLLAKRANGQPLAPTHGPWRAVVPDDRRAARWVRQLQRIELVEVRAGQRDRR